MGVSGKNQDGAKQNIVDYAQQNSVGKRVSTKQNVNK